MPTLRVRPRPKDEGDDSSSQVLMFGPVPGVQAKTKRTLGPFEKWRIPRRPRQVKSDTPGLAIAASLVATGLFADKLLVDKGYWTISFSIRNSSAAQAVVIYFTFHFMREWKYDPGKLLFDKYLANR